MEHKPWPRLRAQAQHVHTQWHVLCSRHGLSYGPTGFACFLGTWANGLSDHTTNVPLHPSFVHFGLGTWPLGRGVQGQRARRIPPPPRGTCHGGPGVGGSYKNFAKLSRQCHNFPI